MLEYLFIIALVIFTVWSAITSTDVLPGFYTRRKK